MSTQSSVSMDTLVSLCKRRGIVFPNSEIYGGFGSTWDYGPLGVELKNNIKRAWWRDMVWARPDIVGLDGAILSAPDVWQASGHVEHFTDALVECRSCHRRFKADELGTNCPHCGASDFTDTRQFNTMFKTFVGPVEDDACGDVPAARDVPDDLSQLPQRPVGGPHEAAVRYCPDRQSLPQ